METPFYFVQKNRKDIKICFWLYHHILLYKRKICLFFSNLRKSAVPYPPEFGEVNLYLKTDQNFLRIGEIEDGENPQRVYENFYNGCAHHNLYGFWKEDNFSSIVKPFYCEMITEYSRNF